MRKIKIVHMIAGLDIGGANVMLHKLLQNFDLDSGQHAVITLMNGGRLRSKLESLGISMHSMGLARGKPTASGLLRLVKLIDQLQPDLIHAWMYHSNVTALIATRLSRSNPKVLWNIRHTPNRLVREERLLTTGLILLGALLSSQPEYIIYNSRRSAERHRGLGYRDNRQVIIPNGFSEEQYKPHLDARMKIRKSLGLDNDNLVIGMVARYHPMKDYQNFIEAAAMLRKTRANVYFVLVGDKVEAANAVLLNQIDARNLKKYVYLLGERADVSEIMASFDVFSLTSAWGEGFPNVIGEAMLSGLPCVATDVGDSAWIIGNTGLIVPARNPESLSNAWEKIIKMGAAERQRLGLKARERIISDYSLKSVVQQYENLFDRALS